MKFLKDNSYEIVRVFINQIGITIFSLFLYTAVGVIDSESLNTNIKIAISVFATLFYFVLLYMASWDIGAKDKIRVDGGRMKPAMYKGALIAFFANIINFVLALISILTVSVFMASGNETFNSAFALINLIMRFLSAMYLGMLQGIFIAFKDNTSLYYLLQSVGFFFMPVFAILVNHIGYVFGMKDKKIFGKTNTHKSK